MIYFARHGNTDANANRVICGGGWDIELNRLGLEQADRLGRMIKDSEIDIERIVSSPMKRAMKTAQLVAESIRADIELDNDLAEWYVGDYERQPIDDHPEFFSDVNPKNGESWMDFETRASRAIMKVMDSKKPSLIVAHGGVWFAFSKRHLGAPAHLGNCALQHIAYDDSKVPVLRAYEVTFMEQEV